MAGTPRLRKREDPEAWVVDVFDLELDEASRAEIAADPSGFFRSLIESEGIPVNGLMIDDKMLNGEEQELGVIVTAHIRSPRELKSHVMTTIIKGV
jgi:hypothetical protein